MWASTVLKGLNEMRKEDILCDVIINTRDGVQVGAHSALLGSASESFFRQVLSQSMNKGNKILMKVEKDSYIIRCIIDYLYTGKAVLDRKYLKELQKTADGYGLTDLQRDCVEQVCASGRVVIVGNIDVSVNPPTEVQQSQQTGPVQLASTQPQGVLTRPWRNTAATTMATSMQGSGDKQRDKPKKVYMYKCKTCERYFSSKTRLESHEAAVHYGTKRYQCSICQRRFIQLDYLREHMIKHSEERSFQCDFCEKSFHTPRQKRKHMQVHEPELQLDCPQCGKTFQRMQRLREHLNNHAAIKTAECPICLKKFASRDATIKHIKVMHFNKGEPLSCSACNVNISSIAELKVHQETCEQCDILMHICEICQASFATQHGLERHQESTHGLAMDYSKTVSNQELQEAYSKAVTRHSKSRPIVNDPQLAQEGHIEDGTDTVDSSDYVIAIEIDQHFQDHLDQL